MSKGTGASLLRFGYIHAAGLVLMTMIAWALAATSNFDRLIPEDTLPVLVGAVSAGAASVLAELQDKGHWLVATLVATALHMLIYYGPLLILLGATANSHMIDDLTTIAGGFLLWYAGIIAAVLVFRSRRKAG